MLNALLFIHHYVPGVDFGVAIIILTLTIKFILYIPSLAAIKQQHAVQDMQPKLEALRKKYKDDREELSRQMVQFYKTNKVNPLSSCLPLLIQLPILFALYRVFFGGLSTDPETGLLAAKQLSHLYGPLRDIYSVTPLNPTFLGFVDLAKNHNVVLAALAGILQFFQSRMIMSRRQPKVSGSADERAVANSSQFMAYLFPLVTVYFSYAFPAGLALYWAVSTAFTVVQQWFYFRRHHHTTGGPTNAAPVGVQPAAEKANAQPQ